MSMIDARSGCARIEPLEPRAYLAARLVGDLNPVTFSTQPTQYTPVNDAAYFVRNSNELWKTDGTLAGTGKVGTFGSRNSTVWGLTPLADPNLLLFQSHYTVYRTDGTPAGTFPVASLNEGPNAYFTDGRRAFWRVDYTQWPSFQPHKELWVSDGTTGGTRKVVDFATDFAAEYPAGLFFFTGTFLNGTFYFLARGNGTISLWSSDGTAAGTRRVTDLGATDGFNDGGDAPRIFSSGGKLFIVRAVGPSFYRMFASDGTAANTVQFEAFTTDAGILDIRTTLAVANGRIFYRKDGDSSGGGIELWSSNGTAAGSAMLKDIVPGRFGSYPDDVTAVGNEVYFDVRSSTASTRYDQLWKTDGTPAGTTLVTTLAASDGAEGIVRAGAGVFYKDGARLKRTDGTAAGTVDVTPANTTELLPAAPLGAGVLFTAKHPIHGDELWYTDGAPASTRVLDLTPETHDGVGGDYVDLNGKAYFAAAHTAHSHGGLMTSDGTPAGTVAVRAELSMQSPIVRSGGRLFFTAWDFFQGAAGRGLWTSDGTTAGTVLVKQFPPTGDVTIARTITDVGGTVFLTVVDGNRRTRLWRSDGTGAGTVQVSSTLALASDPMVAGRTLYFAATEGHPGNGTELYKLDLDGSGVPALVRDINPGGPSDPIPLAAMNGRLYFSALEETPYRSLFVTDGTAAGTLRLGDVAVGPAFVNWNTLRRRAAALNNAVYFTGGTDSSTAGQYGLWKTDGTPEGTVRVVPSTHAAEDVVAAGGRLFFTRSHSINATTVDLLASDGTEAGTVTLGRFDRVGEKFVAHAGRVFFTAQTPFYGWELWSTDGTPGGTRIEADLSPGPGDGTQPYAWAMGAAGGMLLFNGKTPQHGDEPRKWVPGGMPAAQVAGRRVFYNNSAADGFDAAVNAADDNAIAATKSALLPGETADVRNRTNYSRGLNGIMIDVASLPEGDALSADDFAFRFGNGGDPGAWSTPAAPPTVTVRRGAGAYGTDRVTLTWPDRAAVRNAWLQVTVKPTPRTGLAAADVFYFGNLVGDVWVPQGGAMGVTLGDYQRVRRGQHRAPGPWGDTDVNLDGRVNVLDLAHVRAAVGRTLFTLSAPSAAAATILARATASAATQPAVRRRTAYEAALPR